MYGYLPDDGWLTTQNMPALPSFPKANVEAMGGIEGGAASAIKARHEKLRGKPLRWVQTGETYALQEA